jgi:ATP synthase protein I
MVRAIFEGCGSSPEPVFLSAIMTEPGRRPNADRLEEFERRLEATISARKDGAGHDTTEGSAAGLAFRAVSELLVGLLVCMFAGYVADKYFGTAPWIMLALMPLGLAAGVANVMRLSGSKQAEKVLGGGGPTVPAAKDDDGD